MNDKIIIKGAREHNLKNIDLEIPKNKLIVFTGLSGSGKSSLVFDTIYAEGQRRYVESLSSYARQFLGIMKKPDVDLIEGLSPAISIDQKGASHNPRSTVGTVTEIYDYMRLLFARVGHPHCSICGREIEKMSKEQILNKILEMPKKLKDALFAGTMKASFKALILAPIVKGKKGEYKDLFRDLKKRGYKKIRIDNKIYNLDNDLILIKTNKHTIEVIVDALIISKETDKERLSSSLEQALYLSNGEVIISEILDKGFSIPAMPRELKDYLFSEKFACPYDQIALSEIEPRIFSFNTPHGACSLCNGLGNILSVDKNSVFNFDLTINEGGIMPYGEILEKDSWFARTFKTYCAENKIPLNLRMSNLDKKALELLLKGTGEKLYKIKGNNRWGNETVIEESFKGLEEDVLKRHAESESQFMKTYLEKFLHYEVCPLCFGSRLKKEALLITIQNKNIVQVCNLPIGESLIFINSLEALLSERENKISNLILKEIKQRLGFLLDVGLSYLTLARSANTLAGGEAQRIRLASQIGSGLTGVLYVLDEPSIGLHPKDNNRLIKTLKKLRDLGNSVLVVEHDAETMLEADFIYDFGPRAGNEGGEIIAFGTPAEIMKNPKSVTGIYLSGKKKIKIKSSIIEKTEIFHPARDNNFKDDQVSNKKAITIFGASEHNLKNITVSFPLNELVVITGASGSGKSTLILDVLEKALKIKKDEGLSKDLPGKFESITGDEFIRHIFTIDQSPIGRTPRSNPATYTGIFTYIRDIFANTKEAKMKGFGIGKFSFNVKGGRCEACQGEGQIKIEMQFLPDVFVPCEVCNGTQFNSDVLEVKFNDKNIADVLKMNVSEALDFFSFHTSLFHKLQTLNDVGLSYLKLGQIAPTLSGGEAQRIKLANELSKRSRDALYILDEPTTGLHFADLEKLLYVLRKLVDTGNSVIVIEHNLDVIRNADYIIDLGPDGGDMGGEIIAFGSPNEIMKSKKSYTAEFLRKTV